MEGRGLTSLDWAAPWYLPYRRVGELVASRVSSGEPLHAALNAPAAQVLSSTPGRRSSASAFEFVPQDALPPGVPYETFIFDRARCPVRENLHDFFNGLVWLHFPEAKRALNRLQATQIAHHGIAGTRGAVRDAITVFDENGALLDAPPPIWQALVLRDWRRLFVDLRPLWDRARLVVFGHALLEQLATPRKALTAHVWRAQLTLASLAEADARLAALCTAQALAGKPFTPLPVLGVPGWHPGNVNFSFYDDSLVFRPSRVPEARTTAPPADPAGA